MVVTEQDLIELGFEREESNSIDINMDGIFQNVESPSFYNLVVGQIEFPLYRRRNQSQLSDNSLRCRSAYRAQSTSEIPHLF